jgi:acyl-CoA synthetase (AMP-forming)/AMP-acid ligase II
VRDVAVFGEPNPMLGQIVVAKVTVAAPEPVADLKARVRKACQAALSAYKVPAKVVIADGALTNVRQKKERRA